MSTTSAPAVPPSGANCEITPNTPMAAATEVRPSSSGTAAATTAPNASSRITSVIGSEISSARLRSSWSSSSNAFSIVPPPASAG